MSVKTMAIISQAEISCRIRELLSGVSAYGTKLAI
ncbi:MAG: hypothetical protein RLZZ57_1711 [Pseudomonadota bacterium]|jgi:hypothetical protein